VQSFARKILRLIGDVTREEIDKEATVISQLCRPGGCKNIVEVLQHGWLPRNRSIYYIDMEYCPETLEQRIHGKARELAALTMPPVENKSASTIVDVPFPASTQKPASGELLNAESSTMEFDWKPVVDILDDIVSGLVYIHERGMVHRDLKPRNSTSAIQVYTNIA